MRAVSRWGSSGNRLVVMWTNGQHTKGGASSKGTPTLKRQRSPAATPSGHGHGMTPSPRMEAGETQQAKRISVVRPASVGGQGKQRASPQGMRDGRSYAEVASPTPRTNVGRHVEELDEGAGNALEPAMVPRRNLQAELTGASVASPVQQQPTVTKVPTELEELSKELERNSRWRVEDWILKAELALERLHIPRESAEALRAVITRVKPGSTAWLLFVAQRDTPEAGSWVHFSKLLKARLGGARIGFEACVHRLETTKLENFDSFLEFADAFRTAVEEGPVRTDRDTILTLLRAMPEELSVYVRERGGPGLWKEGVASWRATMELAQQFFEVRYPDAIFDKEAHRRWLRDTTAAHQWTRVSKARTQAGGSGNLASTSRERPVKCFACQQYGHIAAACPTVVQGGNARRQTGEEPRSGGGSGGHQAAPRTPLTGGVGQKPRATQAGGAWLKQPTSASAPQQQWINRGQPPMEGRQQPARGTGLLVAETQGSLEELGGDDNAGGRDHVQNDEGGDEDTAWSGQEEQDREEQWQEGDGPRQESSFHPEEDDFVCLAGGGGADDLLWTQGIVMRSRAREERGASGRGPTKDRRRQGEPYDRVVVRCILDSGASRSCVSKKMAQRLGLTVVQKELQIVTAGDARGPQRMKLVTTATDDSPGLLVMGAWFPLKAVVALEGQCTSDLEVDMILGMDFLKLLGATIDFGERRVSFKAFPDQWMRLPTAKEVRMGGRAAWDTQVGSQEPDTLLEPESPWITGEVVGHRGTILLIGMTQEVLSRANGEMARVAGGGVDPKLQYAIKSTTPPVELMQGMAELWKTTGTRGDSSGGDTMEEAGETRFDPPEAPWGEDVWSEAEWEAVVKTATMGAGDGQEDERAVRELINEFQDIFPKELDVRRPLKAAPVEIHTHHNAPIAFPNRRRYTADQMKAVSETLEKLLRLGIVERSMSAYNAPIVLVKKGKGYRMCHDFRRLNEATIPMAVTIPTVQDVFDRLPRAKFLSKIDCTSAYFQLQVAEKDRGKTAFTCHLGTFQYRVCPFGLKNLPAEFNSTISRLFADMSDTMAHFFDDFVAHSEGESFRAHVEVLRRVFLRCRENNVQLSIAKTRLGRRRIELLGFMVGDNQVSMTDDSLQAVERLAAPTTAKGVQQFLGLASFFSPTRVGVCRKG